MNDLFNHHILDCKKITLNLFKVKLFEANRQTCFTSMTLCLRYGQYLSVYVTQNILITEPCEVVPLSNIIIASSISCILSTPGRKNLFAKQKLETVFFSQSVSSAEGKKFKGQSKCMYKKFLLNFAISFIFFMKLMADAAYIIIFVTYRQRAFHVHLI